MFFSRNLQKERKVLAGVPKQVKNRARSLELEGNLASLCIMPWHACCVQASSTPSHEKMRADSQTQTTRFLVQLHCCRRTRSDTKFQKESAGIQTQTFFFFLLLFLNYTVLTQPLISRLFSANTARLDTVHGRPPLVVFMSAPSPWTTSTALVACVFSSHVLSSPSPRVSSLYYYYYYSLVVNNSSLIARWIIFFDRVHDFC